jgi:hypothetical protein
MKLAAGAGIQQAAKSLHSPRGFIGVLEMTTMR